MITSRHHDLVKQFRRLARDDDERFALIDGWHLLEEAIVSGVRIRTIAITASRDEASSLLSRAQDAGVEILQVSTKVMEAISPVRTPTGVAAIVERKSRALSELLRPSPALVVVASDMQDPGNVGALIRSTEAGGGTGVALVGSSADPWSWKGLRAAMGSTFRLPVLRTRDGESLMSSLHTASVRIMASVPRGGTDWSRVDWTAPVAILLGGEGQGLTKAMVQQADEQVSIPMTRPVESLNAAVAAALLVYEARRQRSSGGS